MSDHPAHPSSSAGRRSLASPMTELGKRIVSGVVLIAIALLISWTGGVLAVLAVSVLGFFILAEWERLTGSSSVNRLVSGMLLVVASGFIAHHFGPVPAVMIATALLFLALASALLESKRRWSFTGMAYAVWLVVSLVSLRGHDAGGLSALLLVFFAVWATDIAAYFGGRAIGGPKLMPAVSPNKTWAGAVSGVVATIFVCLVYLVWADALITQSTTHRTGALALVMAALLAGLLSVAAQAGDLFESGLKRKFGVKDSGSILPGHGGFMDRVDGLVFAAITAFLIGLARKGDGTIAEGLLTWGLG